MFSISTNIFRRLPRVFVGLDDPCQRVYDDIAKTVKLLTVSTPEGVYDAIKQLTACGLSSYALRHAATSASMSHDVKLRLLNKADNSIQLLKDHVSALIHTADFREQCLTGMRKLTSTDTDDNDIVMFDLVLALHGSPPCVCFYIPARPIAQVNNHTLVEAPRWVHQVLSEQLALLPDTGSGDQFTVGPAVSIPAPDLVTAAVSIWTAIDGDAYACFADALSAAELLWLS